MYIYDIHIGEDLLMVYRNLSFEMLAGMNYKILLIQDRIYILVQEYDEQYVHYQQR